jgi:hypothetical protein
VGEVAFEVSYVGVVAAVPRLEGYEGEGRGELLFDEPRE